MVVVEVLLLVFGRDRHLSRLSHLIHIFRLRRHHLHPLTRQTEGEIIIIKGVSSYYEAMWQEAKMVGKVSVRGLLLSG